MTIALTQHGVTLPGYGAGPIQGEYAERLLLALQDMPRHPAGLDFRVTGVIERMQGFAGRFHGETSDGYPWGGMYEFQAYRGKVVVLIPSAIGWSLEARHYTFYRYPCAYIKGSASIQDARVVLTRVTEALRPRG